MYEGDVTMAFRAIYDALYARDGAVCGICGGSLELEWDMYLRWRATPKDYKRIQINIDVDHKEAKSKRDEHWWRNDHSNLQLSHRTCNQAKGDS